MKKIIAAIFVFGLLIPGMSAFAKGNFDYIIIRGPGIEEDINITDPVLTQDFFAFADFSKGAVDAPANPGEGYEVVRMYYVNNKPQPFDLLYYFPYTGYVYYDGIANGSSEYDGKWYVENPSVNKPFRAVLTARAKTIWIPLAAFVVILGWFFFAYRAKPKQAQ